MKIKETKLFLAWQFRPEVADFPANVSATTTSTGPRAEYRSGTDLFYLPPTYWLIIPIKGQAFVIDDLAAQQLLAEDDA